MTAQFADPAVTEAKFEREIDEYRSLRRDYEAKGWFLVDANFPEVLVVLAAPQLHPPAIVCAVQFDYTNYDAAPPSVRLVNPFTREPYAFRDVPTQLLRALPVQTLEVPGAPGALQMRGAQPLMQAHEPGDIPFLCVAGNREYHSHPAHSGDAWELHRTSGAGKLVRLLEVIHKYGVAPIANYGVQLVPQIGFEQGQPPE
jgi:hypothetical protein